MKSNLKGKMKIYIDLAHLVCSSGDIRQLGYTVCRNLEDCNNSATVVLHAELLLIDRCGLLAKLSSSSISELSKPDSVSFIWKGVQIWMESGIRWMKIEEDVYLHCRTLYAGIACC